MSRMSRYFSEHTTAAAILRSCTLIAAVIAGASAASPAAAQSFFERLFGAPEARPEARTPAARKPGDTVIRSRDQSGNPGPAYRVLGVVPKTPKPNLSQGERLKQKIAQDLLKAPPAPPTRGPLLLTVSIAKQTVTLYDGGVAVAKSPVSTGTPERPTPTGIFSVIEKQWWHRSNLYSAAPMPFMQRITWSGVALHAGELPGYAASHGCIRLPESFALRLWGTTKIGARVIITRDEVAPLEIKHARLFTLKPAVEPVPVPAPEIKPDEIVKHEHQVPDSLNQGLILLLDGVQNIPAHYGVQPVEHLGDRADPIYIGPGLLEQGELLRKHIPGKRVLIVTNETIAPLYLDK